MVSPDVPREPTKETLEFAPTAFDGAADVVDRRAADHQHSAVAGLDSSGVGACAGAAQLELEVIRARRNICVDGSAVGKAW